MRLKLLLPLIGLIFTLQVYAAVERIVSFEELPKLIKEKNENVKAAEASLQARKERTGYLTRSFLPRISASAGTEEFKTDPLAAERKNYWQIKGEINIYRGGRDKLENDIRKSNESRAQAEYASEFSKELKEARDNYWRLIEISKLINDRKEALQRNEEFLKSSKRRAGAGVATSSDALQFELHRTLLNQELKKMTLEEDLLKNRLAVAIGHDDHKGLKVKGDFDHPPEEIQVPIQEPNKNTEVQGLRALEISESLQKSKAYRWWHPRLDIYSAYGIPSLSDEYTRALNQEKEWTVGAVMTLDFGESIEDRKEGVAKGFEALAAKKRADHRLREVTAEDHELRHDLTLLHELIHDADKDIDKADRFLKLTQSEYSRGVKNGPDLLEAFKQLYEFRERRVGLYREYYTTQAELLALVGGDTIQ